MHTTYTLRSILIFPHILTKCWCYPSSHCQAEKVEMLTILSFPAVNSWLRFVTRRLKVQLLLLLSFRIMLHSLQSQVQDAKPHYQSMHSHIFYLPVSLFINNVMNAYELSYRSHNPLNFKIFIISPLPLRNCVCLFAFACF